ncbi:MAG: hypothetical protein HY903_22345 [Deltaproteobacteria bacterium]|nr:hypothetical protein [Deltaproteobacteria bacterium]
MMFAPACFAVLMAGGAAGPALTPEPLQTNCADRGCHDVILTGALQTLHKPTRMGKCKACHRGPGPEVKAAGHPQNVWMVKNAGPCRGCHGTIVHGMKTARMVHGALTAEACLACHAPHSTLRPHLLRVATDAEACSQCHALPDYKFVHSPVAADACLSCHTPHFSDNRSLLARVGRELCARCHDPKERPHGPAAVDCLTCHAPHGGNKRRLLRIDNAPDAAP